MDFSKPTLQDLDSNETDKFSESQIQEKIFIDKNSCSIQTKHEITHHKCDLGNGNIQNSMHSKYKQLDPKNIQNLNTRNDITSVQNIKPLSNENDLTDLGNSNLNTVKCQDCSDKRFRLPNQDSQIEQTSALEIELNVPLSICSKFGKKKKIAEHLNNDILITSDPSNRNVQQLIGFQKVVDEKETIEKNTEMIATSSKDSIKSNTKSKKRLLMSQNNAEQENTSNIDIETHIHGSDPINKNSKRFFDTQNIIDDKQNSTAKIYNIETSEDNHLNKSRFEEIEDKLEEMFAGIEDEKSENTTTADKHTIKKKSQDSINNFIKVNRIDIGTNKNMKMFLDDDLKNDKLTSLQTKAAKKSSNTISRNDKNITLKSVLTNQKDQTIPNSILYLKTMRRKHSMNKELLTCSAKTNEGVNEERGKNIVLFKENGMTSSPHNSKEVKKSKYVCKSKIKSNRKNFSEYKKDKNKKVVKSRNNKKKNITEPHNKSNQQKIKLHLSSENDSEERPLQTKEIETKHRSPFILVKNNGSITIINTVTADDSNEKWTRSKKASNYVYERKTVKGCHSSTLSNRYDADTADSSWICVLCKIGPHKKRLGDLFGPYIISSDCDEYRSINECIQRSVLCINERPVSDIHKIMECNEENTIDNYTIGMSRISDECYEIWIHEDCAIWAPNIFVVGSRLVGLEDVAWNSIRYECVYCLKGGALICCLQRDCKTTSHVPCARESNWLLDESRFWAYCSKHVLNKF